MISVLMIALPSSGSEGHWHRQQTDGHPHPCRQGKLPALPGSAARRCTVWPVRHSSMPRRVPQHPKRLL